MKRWKIATTLLRSRLENGSTTTRWLKSNGCHEGGILRTYERQVKSDAQDLTWIVELVVVYVTSHVASVQVLMLYSHFVAMQSTSNCIRCNVVRWQALTLWSDCAVVPSAGNCISCDFVRWCSCEKTRVPWRIKG